MTIHDQAFDGMVLTQWDLIQARTRMQPDPVEIADLQTSISDRRIALALANQLPIWWLDRNGNPPRRA